MTQPDDRPLPPDPNPFPVDSATRLCCGGIGGHTRGCPTIEVSAAAPLFVVVDLVGAVGHLRQAARLIDRAAVAIDRASEAVTR